MLWFITLLLIRHYAIIYYYYLRRLRWLFCFISYWLLMPPCLFQILILRRLPLRLRWLRHFIDAAAAISSDCHYASHFRHYASLRHCRRWWLYWCQDYHWRRRATPFTPLRLSCYFFAFFIFIYFLRFSMPLSLRQSRWLLPPFSLIDYYAASWLLIFTPLITPLLSEAPQHWWYAIAFSPR